MAQPEDETRWEAESPDEIPTTEEFYKASALTLSSAPFVQDQYLITENVPIIDNEGNIVNSQGTYKLGDYYMFDATDTPQQDMDDETGKVLGTPEEITAIREAHNAKRKQLLKEEDSVLRIRLSDGAGNLIERNSYFLFRKGRIKKNGWLRMAVIPDLRSGIPSPIPENIPDDQILIVRMGGSQSNISVLVNPADDAQLVKIYKTFPQRFKAK